MQIELQGSKHYFKISLSQVAGAYRNNRKIAKAMPKIEISCLQSNASSSFLQTCINFVEQQLKFSHFEGSVIPQVIFC